MRLNRTSVFDNHTRARRILLASSILFVTSLNQADIYQWTDDQGTTHFSDQPVEGSAVSVERMPDIKLDKSNGSTSNQDKKPKSAAVNKNSDKTEAKEGSEKNFSDLTDELIKAREIREAKRKKRKQEKEEKAIQCQSEKTKLALMEKELQDLDERLKKMSRKEREKSVEYIKSSDLSIRLKRQKNIKYGLCK